MPDLHTEIWQQIFHLVRRDTPPPSFPCLWSGLHQHDLSTLMRVSVRFNKIAGPILYSSVTTLHFHELVRGFNDITLPSHPPVPSKKMLLKHVRRLYIADRGPTCESAVTARKLLGGSNWREVGETREEQRERMITEGIAEVDIAVEQLQNLPRGAILMPNLEAATLGQPGACAWEHIEGEKRAQPIMNQLMTTRVYLTDALLRCRPKSICLYSTRGPYVLISCPAPFHNPKLVITSHITEFPRFPPMLIPGATTRVIFSPGVSRVNSRFGGSQWDGSETISEIAFAVRMCHALEHRTSPTEPRIVNPDAKIELYGFCHAAMDVLTAALPNDFTKGDIGLDSDEVPGRSGNIRTGDMHGMDDEFDSWRANNSLFDRAALMAFETREDMRAQESLLMQACRTTPCPEKPMRKFWKSKLSFHQWRDSPCCDACGWDINDVARWQQWEDIAKSMWEEHETHHCQGDHHHDLPYDIPFDIGNYLGSLAGGFGLPFYDGL